MIGEVGILNVGAGDTKLTFDPSKPDEVKRSAGIVKDMIRRGFVLLVEVGKDDTGPLYRRAYDFDEGTCEYIVAGTANDAPATMETESNEQESTNPKKGGRKAATRRTSKPTRVKASSTKAIAVAKTAGG